MTKMEHHAGPGPCEACENSALTDLADVMNALFAYARASTDLLRAMHDVAAPTDLRDDVAQFIGQIVLHVANEPGIAEEAA